MTEGTRLNQLAEKVANLRDDNTEAKEFQRSMQEFQTNAQTTLGKHKALFNSIQSQLSSLAASYNNLSINRIQGETNGENSNVGVPFAERGGIQARTIKLDFPRFDGTEPHDWILKVEQFFSYGNTPDDQKVTIASFHMEGRALSWYNWLRDSGPIRGWEAFIDALRVRVCTFSL